MPLEEVGGEKVGIGGEEHFKLREQRVQREPGDLSREKKRTRQRGVRGEVCVRVSRVGTASAALVVVARTWVVTLNETEGRHLCMF